MTWFVHGLNTVREKSNILLELFLFNKTQHLVSESVIILLAPYTSRRTCLNDKRIYWSLRSINYQNPKREEKMISTGLKVT